MRKKSKNKNGRFNLIDSIALDPSIGCGRLFIGREGLAPDGVETLTNLVLNYNSNSDYIVQNRFDRPCELDWSVCPGCRTS